MQAIILAAGKSSRLFPFGGATHKAALSLMGKSLISRTIESLRSCSVSEIIVVVSPGNGIESALASDGIDLTGVTFVSHEGARGMGEALLDAVTHIKDDFFIVHAHHFECSNFLPQLIEKKKVNNADGTIVVRQESDAVNFGVVSFEGERISEVHEKPENAKDQFRIVGMYLLSKSFLSELQRVEKEHYSFEAALHGYVKKANVIGVRTDEETLTLKYPWDLLDMSGYLLNNLTPARSDNATIAPSAVLEGNILISDGVTIEAGAVIKGPCFLGENAYVGTNAILRNGVIIESDAVVGAAMEIKHSILMKGATTHSGYIGDSVIGENAKIAALFCTGNVRIDRGVIQAVVKDEKIATHLKSLGAFIGHRTKVGIRVSTMPGVLIGQDVVVGPSTTVFKNIPSDVQYYAKITEVIERPAQSDLKQEKNKVVLFDIDYTLFDTKAFKESELKSFTVYEEVADALGEIGAFAELGIFSEGEEDFQKAKLIETAIDSHFRDTHVHIVKKKNDVFPEVLDQYKKSTLFLVDDRLEVLFKAKKHMPEMYAIWMKRGPFAEDQKPIEGFSPDATIDDLRMILPIVAGE